MDDISIGTNHGAVGEFHGPVVFQGPVHPAPRSPVEWPHRVGVVPLRADCYQDRPVPAGPVLVLCGLGGVGKTQLAAALAERAWAAGELDLLVWLTATSRQAVQAGYAQAAAEILGADAADRDRAADRLLAWLAATERRWLVVLDNLVEPGHLRKLWPPAAGRTVVTTRHRTGLTGSGRTLVDVGLFSPEQSVAYLTDRLAARPGLADDPAALAGALGHLPLALAQASAYQLDRGADCTGYLALLADRGQRLDRLRPDVLPDDQDTAVAATWSLSAALADRSPHPGLAEPLLRLAAVLDANGIPAEVLHTPAVTSWLTAKRMTDSGYLVAAENLRRQLWIDFRADQGVTAYERMKARLNRRAVAWTLRRFAVEPVTGEVVDGTLHRLHALSLAAHDPSSPARTLRVHPLVQRATREATPAADLTRVARIAADALIEAWQTAPHAPGVGQAFHDCIRALTANAPEVLWSGPHAALVVVAEVLVGVGQERAAVEYLTWLVAEARRRLGDEHVYLLGIRQALAAALGRSGDPFAEVAEMEAVHADAVRAHGPAWPGLPALRHNLCTAWWKVGRTAEAAAAMEQVVPLSEAMQGRWHVNTLYARHTLAHLRGELGDAAGACAEYARLLAAAKRLPSPSAEMFTLHARVQLAHWRGKAGDPAAAAGDLRTLVAEQEPLLGPFHRRILAMRQSLAHWQGEAGDPAGAVAAFEALLADWLLVQAPDNPDTMATRQLLAEWRAKAGDPQAAIADLESLLTDRLRVLTPDHPDTRTTRAELARLRS